MKSLFSILCLVFFLVSCSGIRKGVYEPKGWVEVGEGTRGFAYVDVDGVRQHDGSVYYWVMVDYPTPIGGGFMSGKIYEQGDCEMFRVKILSFFYYKEPMGEGKSSEGFNMSDLTWGYPPHGSTGEKILKTVCDSVKTK